MSRDMVGGWEDRRVKKFRMGEGETERVEEDLVGRRKD